VRDAFGGGVGAVGAAEGVVDVDVAEGCELAGELGVVLFFLFVEAKIFEQEGLARLQVADHLGGDVADTVGGEGYVFVVADDVVEELAEAIDDGAKAHGGDDLALGTSEVRAEDDSGLAAEGVLDGGDGLANARVVGDARVAAVAVGCERHVEVDTDEDALVGEVKIADGQLGHASSFSFEFLQDQFGLQEK
jgi:hypothetical protein